MVRQRIRAAIGILDWLHARNLTLATCRQSDLDLWLTNHDDAGRRFGTDHFVRWAIAHNIKRNLQFAATRWTGPTHPRSRRGAGTKPNACSMTTPSIPTTACRLLRLLYAQRPAAISRLTVDDINLSDGTVKPTFGQIQ
jgi:hypothetical protein